MELYVRELNENDYEDILVGWWKQWGWVAPKRDFLPNNGKGGIIVYDEDADGDGNSDWVDWEDEDGNDILHDI